MERVNGTGVRGRTTPGEIQGEFDWECLGRGAEEVGKDVLDAVGRELPEQPSGDIQTEPGEYLRKDVGEAVGRGAVVVTVNERSARTFRNDWDELQRASGRDRWEPAKVLSWRSWLASLWRRMLLEGTAKALLLNAFQEHAVWSGILKEDEAAGAQGEVEGLAGMAAESWARICAYAGGGGATGEGRLRRISSRLTGENGSADTEAFARWARAFERRCEAEGLLSGSELDRAIADAVRAGELRIEQKELLLVGFDRLTPVQVRLVKAMETAGVVVLQAVLHVSRRRRLLTAGADGAEELRACARWAAGWIDREPRARVAVIVPDLAGERAGMERVFREVMAPEMEWIGAGEGDAPYEFSLGRMLSETPMVLVGLELLRWIEGALPLERVSALLVSEYFAGREGEGQARAEFDAHELRATKMLRPEMSLRGLVEEVAGSRRAKRLRGLLAALRGMERLRTEFEGMSQSYGEWAQRVRELLAEAGWGAAGTETSEEFQTRDRWEGALDAMATLDFEGRAVEYGDVLRAIGRIAGETVFAPASRSAPVQIMGPMEAAGGEFDAVWFLRAGEASWPAVSQPLPLLRWGLQRDLGMPGTDAERDRAEARQVTERMLGSAPEVVASYALSYSGGRGEGRQRSSPLLRGMGFGEVAIGDVAGVEPERVVVGMDLVEEVGQVRPLPDEVLRGGVQVLTLQAACGFRAFAERRLWSGEMEEPALGLSAKESGTAVHGALECFWNEVGSQAKLIAMSEEERADALSRAIDKGLRRADATSAGGWDRAYLEVVKERLRRLLTRWLEEETQRPAFEVKRSEEGLRDVHVGPLRFQLRVDRVDLVDGAEVLIDYKTGEAELKDWKGERPDGPQVPLYAILAARGVEEREATGEEMAGEGLGAVAFGRVRAGTEAGLVGYAERDGLLSGKLKKMEAGTFQAQVDRWREVLERLAGEFAAGDARVRPKNYPGTCGRCGQRILCRLDASLLDEIEEEGEERTREGEDG